MGANTISAIAGGRKYTNEIHGKSLATMSIDEMFKALGLPRCI